MHLPKMASRRGKKMTEKQARFMLMDGFSSDSDECLTDDSTKDPDFVPSPPPKKNSPHTLSPLRVTQEPETFHPLQPDSSLQTDLSAKPDSLSQLDHSLQAEPLLQIESNHVLQHGPSPQPDYTLQPGPSPQPSYGLQPGPHHSLAPHHSSSSQSDPSSQLGLSSQFGSSSQPGPSLQHDYSLQSGSSSQPGPSLQHDYSLQSGSSSQPGPSLQNDYSLQSGSSSQPGPSPQLDYSLQPGFSSQPGPSPQLDCSLQPGSSSQPGPSPQLDSSLQSGPSLQLDCSLQSGPFLQLGSSSQPCPSSQLDYSLQSGPSLQPGPSPQLDYSLQPGSSSQPGPSFRPDYSLQPGPSSQPEDLLESDHPLQSSNSQQVDSSIPLEKPTKCRKRLRNPQQWQCNISKKLRGEGKAYISRFTKKTIPAKTIKNINDCKGSCRFKCKDLITGDERHNIHKDYWGLNESEKTHFLSINTERVEKKRKITKSEISRRNFSLLYFFTIEKGRKIRVCKEYFLATLDISQRKVSYMYEKLLDINTGTPQSKRQGKHSKNCLKEEIKESVREHIKSIPVVDSHYCRSNSAKKYFEATLNISILYDKYCSFCKEKQYVPAKKHMYTTIFQTEFNINFLKPKKDRCDKCEVHRIKGHESGVSDDERKANEAHVFAKEDARNERKNDRESSKVVISFDMQNVVTLPKADVSNFFYKRKLSTFNLTAHVSQDNLAYCAIWHEGLSGRSGNDIASAMTKILHSFMSKYPDTKELVLWSDSCVPQNKNKIMSLAIKIFMAQYPNIKIITQKFSESGHSCIQQVDAIHSVIDRAMAPSELYSPIGFIRLLKNVRRTPGLLTLQMKPTDFFKFHSASEQLDFKSVPFTKVKQLIFKQNEPFHLSFKLKHSEENACTVSLRKALKTRQEINKVLPSSLPNVQAQSERYKVTLTKEKINDLNSMLDFLPKVDREYMISLL